MSERPIVPLELRGGILAAAVGTPNARPLARLVNGTTTDAPPLEMHDPEFKDVMRDGERVVDALNRHPEMVDVLRGLAEFEEADLSSDAAANRVRHLAAQAKGLVGRVEDVG